MSHRRFSINLVTNILNFGFNILIGIWLTPYLIRHLGIGAYGLIPLATTVTTYLAIFTLALNSAVGRFMTIALEQNEHAEANRIFNTSFWGSAGILILLLGPCIWLSLHAGWFFKVPTGSENDFAWLFLTVIGVFFLTTLSSAFSITAFCRNRFDLSNWVNILSAIVRVAIIVVLFSSGTPRVWHVGFALFIATGVTGIGAILIWRYLTPTLEIKLSWFSRASLRAMTGMGSWIVINTVGSILYLSIDLLVINQMLGSDATGKYGAVMTWSALLRNFAGVIAGVFGPTIITLYSRNDLSGLVQYSRQAIKFLGLVIAIPIGLICGLSKPLLLLWLGASFSYLAPLMSLMTFHLCVNLAILPLFNIQVATNRVRIPGIVTCVMGLMNLALAVILVGTAGWGMYGVAAAGAIMLTAKNLVFTPVYAAKFLGLKWTSFYHETIPVIAFTMGLAILGWLITGWLGISSWFKLIAAGTILGTMSAVFIYAVILDRAERSQLLRMLFPWRPVTNG